MLARVRPWLPALLLVLAPLVTGCGDDATPASPVATLPTATTLNKALPTGWPSELQLPAGSTVYDSADRDGLLSVNFETQELAASVSRFLFSELSAGGWTKGATDDLDGTLTTTWSKGADELGIDVEDTGNTTEVTIRISSTSSPGASSSAG